MQLRDNVQFLERSMPTGSIKVLAGSSPDDAFSVDVGLGSTMTATDILDGIMRITGAETGSYKTAEFIVTTFQQQMQEILNDK